MFSQSAGIIGAVDVLQDKDSTARGIPPVGDGFRALRPVRDLISLAALLCLLPLAVIAEIPYDLVLKGGRVIDPETGLDLAGGGARL